MTSVNKVKNLLITGIPGIGKTTTILHILESFRSSTAHCKYQLNIQGFYTQEVRCSSASRYAKRIGFDIIPVSTAISSKDRNISHSKLHEVQKQSSVILARVEKHLPNEMYEQQCENRKMFPKVGKYFVNLLAFEECVLPLLSWNSKNINRNGSSNDVIHVFIVDEIGSMELFSTRFQKSVGQLLDNEECIVIATIPLKSRSTFVRNLHKRTDCKLFSLTHSNRQNMRSTIVQYLSQMIENW